MLGGARRRRAPALGRWSLRLPTSRARARVGAFQRTASLDDRECECHPTKPFCLAHRQETLVGSARRHTCAVHDLWTRRHLLGDAHIDRSDGKRPRPLTADDPRSRGRECNSARLETGGQLTTLGSVWAAQLRCRLPATSRPSSWKAAIQATWVPWTLAETTRCAVCAPGTSLLARGGSLMSKMGSIARHFGLP